MFHSTQNHNQHFSSNHSDWNTEISSFCLQVFRVFIVIFIFQRQAKNKEEVIIVESFCGHFIIVIFLHVKQCSLSLTDKQEVPVFSAVQFFV